MSVAASRAPISFDPRGAAETDAKPRLLIVDDVADNRIVLARRFLRRGYEIVEADSGEAALALLERESFDVVLLDVMMPGIDGFETLHCIRQHPVNKDVPVIMVTARTQSNDIVAALQAGANDYVTKPVDFAVALTRVEAQVERKRQREKAERASEALARLNRDLEQRVRERTARLEAINRELAAEIEQRHRSEAQSEYLAQYDSLTGLANRALFLRELDRSLDACRASGRDVAVILIDLDSFKSVNDALGHSTGDAILQVVAQRLRSTLKDVDCIARLGGDEFAVLQIDEAQPQGALAISSQILDALGQRMTSGRRELTLGASAGVAVSRRGDIGVEELMKNAETAMYRAKADGRNVYRVFDADMDKAAQTRRELELDLRNAIARQELELFFQPLVGVATRRISGFEALLRWRRHGVLVSPAEFVPIAEETGVITPIGAWVLRQACMEAAAWSQPLKVAVNLSAVQFRSEGLVGAVVNALAASGLAPARLELEITESVMFERSKHNLQTLNQLRALGVSISMDDFGTGYSSLSYLHNFRFDKIKIDQSFVSRMVEDANSLAIVRAILSLGQSFGITTTAEGVETEEQLACLMREGCDEAQGRLFSMPAPAAEAQTLIDRLG